MFSDILLNKRSAILEKWQQYLLETYPADTSRFMKQEKDRFLNPVGHTFSEDMPVLFDLLMAKAGPAEMVARMDRMLKIRSVQDFSPGQAVFFVFLLKRAVREEVLDEISGNGGLLDLLQFESRIDTLALAAFDGYMKYREKIFEIRANEVKMRSLKLIERINRMEGRCTTAEELAPEKISVDSSTAEKKNRGDSGEMKGGTD